MYVAMLLSILKAVNNDVEEERNLCTHHYFTRVCVDLMVLSHGHCQRGNTLFMIHYWQ